MIQRIVLITTPFSGTFALIIRFAEFFTLDIFTDSAWTSVNLRIWGNAVEPGTYLIAACLPSLRPLFRPLLKDFSFRSLRSRLLGTGGTEATAASHDNSVRGVRLFNYKQMSDSSVHKNAGSIGDGNDETELVTSYGGFNTPSVTAQAKPLDPEAGHGHRRHNGPDIMVETTYSSESEPAGRKLRSLQIR
jgi:hypothetical protein